jgi:hypothetical protein
MTPKPCAIKDCPALRKPRSRWCAVHAAMTDAERQAEQDGAVCSQPLTLRRVTTRIEYE